MKENYEKFMDWYQKFIAKNGVGHYLCDKVWFNEVQESHASLRDFLNDNIEVTWEVEIKQKEGAANNADAKEILKNIKKLIAYQDRSIGGHPDQDFLLPTIQMGSHRAIKTNKFLMNEFAARVDKYDYDYKELSAKFNKELSKLAALWNKQRTTKATYQVKLDTAAQAFINLAYYGPDTDSCFRQGGCSDKSKRNIAVAKNSYVITINDGKNCLSRMWGFSNSKFDTFNICNVYQKGMNEGNILSAVQQYFATLLGTEIEDIKIHEDKRNEADEDEEDEVGKIKVPEGIYHNGYGSFTFSTKEKIGQQQMVVEDCLL